MYWSHSVASQGRTLEKSIEWVYREGQAATSLATYVSIMSGGGSEQPLLMRRGSQVLSGSGESHGEPLQHTNTSASTQSTVV